MDRKLIIWSIAVFFGCSILFQAIDAAASGSGKGVSLGIQAAAMVVILAVVIVVVRKKS